MKTVLRIVLVVVLLLVGITQAQTMTVVDSGKKQQTSTAAIKLTPVRPLVAVPVDIEVVCDVPFSVQMTATGGKLPYTWTATGLPPGVTMSTAGVMSGTIPCSALPPVISPTMKPVSTAVK